MSGERVVVVFGGRSGEHEVSVTSARSVMAALAAAGFDVVPLGIDRRGGWLSEPATAEQLASGTNALSDGAPILEAADALETLHGADVVFPLVHGTFGEDGTLQGFFEIANVPYCGAGVAASAIGMDKALMKALFRDAGIPVSRYGVLRTWEYERSPEEARRFVASQTGFPCFVKPANGGSSVGVSRARSAEDLDAAFEAAFAYDDKLLVEEAVTGREIEVSVIGNEWPEASIPGEIIPDREFYDYDSKYSAESTTQLLIPAPLSDSATEKVRELAVRMYQAMGCEGFARVDFFVEGESVVANEVNTIPGFTSISMFPKLWEASGLSYGQLLTRIVELGLSRHARRAK